MKASLVENRNTYRLLNLPENPTMVTLVNGLTYNLVKRTSVSGKSWSWHFQLRKEDEMGIVGYTTNEKSAISFAIGSDGQLCRQRVSLNGGNPKSYWTYPNPLELISEIN